MAELNLKSADERLGLAPLSKIKAALDRLFGGSEWLGWEPETISLELGMVMDDLLLDKIHVLKILLQNPETVLDDPAFILYGTEAINNNTVDFESVPAPTSLELAFAITEIKKVLEAAGAKFVPGNALILLTAWHLRQEGYSKRLPPFDFVPENMLELGQTAADTEAKRQAIEAYIKHMESI